MMEQFYLVELYRSKPPSATKTGRDRSPVSGCEAPLGSLACSTMQQRSTSWHTRSLGRMRMRPASRGVIYDVARVAPQPTRPPAPSREEHT